MLNKIKNFLKKTPFTNEVNEYNEFKNTKEIFVEEVLFLDEDKTFENEIKSGI
jgi:hypothetical protein